MRSKAVSGGVSRLLVLVLLCVLSPASAATGGTIISQISDPVNASIVAHLDILEARIEQNRGTLTFFIRTRGSIPTTLPAPADTVTYLWFVDADNNPTTGQPHGGVGSEFNVRAVIGQTYGGGYVDRTGSLPGGGRGTVTVNGDLISMTVSLSQIASPAQFTWRSGAFQSIRGVNTSHPDTAIATATTLPYEPPASVEITTPLLMLSPAGPTTGALTVEVRDGAGALLDLADLTMMCTGSNPAVATVDSNAVVTVHAVPASFWDTPYVNVSVEGVSSVNSAVIRSTTTNLGVVHIPHPGENVSFYLPATLDCEDLEAVTSGYQVVESSDIAYAAQRTVTGNLPFGGATQYFILDVTDDPNTVPCGLSGNLIRLGWIVGDPLHSS